MSDLEPLSTLLERHCPSARSPTALQELTLYRLTRSVPPTRTVYFPRLCLVLNGSKHIESGQRVARLSAGELWACTVDVPVIVTVDVGEPVHRALTLDINRDILAEMLAHIEPPAPLAPDGPATAKANAPFLKALRSYMSLLDTPKDIGALEPLHYREVLYRLLQLPRAGALMGLLGPARHREPIHRAIQWLKGNYQRAVTLEQLCEITHMSESALHKHFKALTSLSPLQYRAQLRLHEARRRLLTGERDIGLLAHQVGYQSPSQFSREYKRFFGTTPSGERP